MYMVLSALVLYFMVSVTKISHLIQALLIAIMTAGYVLVVSLTHAGLFDAHDSLYG